MHMLCPTALHGFPPGVTAYSMSGDERCRLKHLPNLILVRMEPRSRLDLDHYNDGTVYLMAGNSQIDLPDVTDSRPGWAPPFDFGQVGMYLYFSSRDGRCVLTAKTSVTLILYIA